MPRWLRQFTFNQINDFYKKESEANENVSNKGSNKATLMDSSGKINRENFPNIQQKPSSKVNYK